jgi:hypothetical protein
MDPRMGTIDRNCWALWPHRVGKARIPSWCVICFSAFDSFSLRWSRTGLFVKSEESRYRESTSPFFSPLDTSSKIATRALYPLLLFGDADTVVSVCSGRLETLRINKEVLLDLLRSLLDCCNTPRQLTRATLSFRLL